MPLQVESMVTFVIKIAVMIVDEVMVAMIVGYTDNKNSLSNICPQLIHLETWIFPYFEYGSRIYNVHCWQHSFLNNTRKF